MLTRLHSLLTTRLHTLLIIPVRACHLAMTCTITMLVGGSTSLPRNVKELGSCVDVLVAPSTQVDDHTRTIGQLRAQPGAPNKQFQTCPSPTPALVHVPRQQ